MRYEHLGESVYLQVYALRCCALRRAVLLRFLDITIDQHRVDLLSRNRTKAITTLMRECDDLSVY